MNSTCLFIRPCQNLSTFADQDSWHEAELHNTKAELARLRKALAEIMGVCRRVAAEEHMAGGPDLRSSALEENYLSSHSALTTRPAATAHGQRSNTVGSNEGAAFSTHSLDSDGDPDE